MSAEIDKRLLATGLVLILVAVIALYTIPEVIEYFSSLYAAPTPVTYKYTTGLRAKLTIINGTSGSALTSGVSVNVYSSTENPFAYKYTGSPLYTAVYDSTEGAWVIGGIDAGTYVLVIYDSSGNMGPVKETITITGTDDEDREVWVEPSSFTIYNIVSVTVVDYDIANLTASLGAVDNVHCTYDGTHEGINGTDSGAYGQGDYWRITYDISVSAGVTQTEKAKAPIRIYFTDLSDVFSFDAVYVDGVKYTLSDDDDATDDGYSGLFIELSSDWLSSSSHTIQLYLSQVSSEGKDATGHTLTMTIAWQFDCLNSNFRTWSDVTQSISCYDV